MLDLGMANDLKALLPALPVRLYGCYDENDEKREQFGS